MIRFLCPFLVTDLKQIPKSLVAKYNLGLEGVIFDGSKLQSEFKRIKANLLQVQKEFPGKLISLHYPTDNADYIKGGREFLKLLEFIKMAQSLGIRKIILHSNFFVDAFAFNQSTLKAQGAKYLSVFKKLDRILEGFETRICIENMPIIGDQGENFDSIFVFPEDFHIIKKFKNIKINWDLGHWAITCKLLWDIKRLSLRTASIKINFSEYLENERDIIHFHLSSFSGNTFINSNALCREGIPPSRGDIDESYFTNALKRISKSGKITDVSLEINETNYYSRPNLLETLGWLHKNKFI